MTSFNVTAVLAKSSVIHQLILDFTIKIIQSEDRKLLSDFCDMSCPNTIVPGLVKRYVYQPYIVNRYSAYGYGS